MGTTRYGAMAERSHVKPSISSLRAYNSFFILFFLYFQGFPTKFYYARQTKTEYWLFGKLEIENPGGDPSRRIVLQVLSFLGQLQFNCKWDSTFCKLARIVLGVELKMAKISCANWSGKGRERLHKSIRFSEQIFINAYDIFDVQMTPGFVYRIIITIRLPKS